MTRTTDRSTPPKRRAPGRPGRLRPLDGDVREAIVTAALTQLQASGDPRTVTIASVLTDAGCTPPSLYHYWSSRDLLLREAGERGWARFQTMQESAGLTSDDPLTRIRARGKAYLEFAIAHPGLFQVLFLHPQPTPDRSLDPTPTGTAGRALLALIADVEQAMSGGHLRHADPMTIAVALWATVHGLATLWATTPAPRPLADAAFDTAQIALFRGLAD
jgi:AcrR family transcriptional regulator